MLCPSNITKRLLIRALQPIRLVERECCKLLALTADRSSIQHRSPSASRHNDPNADLRKALTNSSHLVLTSAREVCDILALQTIRLVERECCKLLALTADRSSMSRRSPSASRRHDPNADLRKALTNISHLVLTSAREVCDILALQATHLVERECCKLLALTADRSSMSHRSPSASRRHDPNADLRKALTNTSRPVLTSAREVCDILALQTIRLVERECCKLLAPTARSILDVTPLTQRFKTPRSQRRFTQGPSQIVRTSC